MTTNFNNWEKDFDKQTKLASKVNSDVLEEVVEIFTARVVKRTPIGKPELWKNPNPPAGYTPGTLKSSWAIDWDKRDGSVIGAAVYNPQPYAVRIENGWSTQTPPNGMMKTTFAELGEITNIAIKRKSK